jgi:hypothetical protein
VLFLAGEPLKATAPSIAISLVQSIQQQFRVLVLALHYLGSKSQNYTDRAEFTVLNPTEAEEAFD